MHKCKRNFFKALLNSKIKTYFVHNKKKMDIWLSQTAFLK